MCVHAPQFEEAQAAGPPSGHRAAMRVPPMLEVVMRRLPTQQAEIGNPVREFEIDPVEEPVPSFPEEDPAEAPATPSREPERVPA